MKRFIPIVLLIFALLMTASYSQDRDLSIYGTEGWDVEDSRTAFYDLYLMRLLSNPGGRWNINTRRIDSLLNALIIYTDSTQLRIERDPLTGEDTLKFAPDFVEGIVADSLNYFDYIPQLTTPTHKEGRTFYDGLDHSLNLQLDRGVTHRLGRETFVEICNGNGDTIRVGEAVRFSRVVDRGGIPYACFLRANAKEDSTSRTLGIAVHEIPPDSTGYVTVFGAVFGLNTSSWEERDIVYLDTLNGQLTNKKPNAKYNIIPVGVVFVKGNPGAIGVEISGAVTDSDVGSFYFTDESELISLTQGVEAQITNGTNDLLTTDEDLTHNIWIENDYIQIESDGVYDINSTWSFGGGTGGIYEVYMKVNGVFEGKYVSSRATSNADVGNMSFVATKRLDAGDSVSFWVVNTNSGTDFLAIHGVVRIEQVR